MITSHENQIIFSRQMKVLRLSVEKNWVLDPRPRSNRLADETVGNMAAIPGFLHFYTSKDYCTITLVQILAAWTAVAVSNYASPSTSLMTRTAVSLRLFCMVFSVLCFTLIRIKSRIKLTVCYDSILRFSFKYYSLMALFTDGVVEYS